MFGHGSITGAEPGPHILLVPIWSRTILWRNHHPLTFLFLSGPEVNYCRSQRQRQRLLRESLADSPNVRYFTNLQRLTWHCRSEGWFMNCKVCSLALWLLIPALLLCQCLRHVSINYDKWYEIRYGHSQTAAIADHCVRYCCGYSVNFYEIIPNLHRTLIAADARHQSMHWTGVHRVNNLLI